MNKKVLSLSLSGAVLIGGLGVSVYQLRDSHEEINKLKETQVKLESQLDDKNTTLDQVTRENRGLQHDREVLDKEIMRLKDIETDFILYKQMHESTHKYPSDGESPRSCSLGNPTKSTKVVTAYTANEESTGKSVGDPDYGVMASGYTVFRGAIAMGKSYPMGTIVYIPSAGWTINLDRGGAITDDKIDLFIPGLGTALDWGRPSLEVDIYPMPEGASLEARINLVKSLRESEGMPSTGL